MSKLSRNAKFQQVEHRTKTHNHSNFGSLLNEAAGYFRTNPFATVNMYATFIESGKVVFPMAFDPFTLGFNHITFAEDITNGHEGSTECQLECIGYDHDKCAFIYQLMTPANADQPTGGTPVESKASGTAKFTFQKHTKGNTFAVSSEVIGDVNYIKCDHRLQLVDGAKIKIADATQFVNDGAVYQIYFSHIKEIEVETEPAEVTEEGQTQQKVKRAQYYYKTVNKEHTLSTETAVKRILTDGEGSWVKNAVLDNIKNDRLSATQVREIIAKGKVYPA